MRELNTTRRRSDNMCTNVVYSWKWTDDGVTSLQGNASAGWIGRGKTIYDVSHPGFRKRVSAGEVVMGDMWLFVEEYDQSPVSWTVAFQLNGKSHVEVWSDYWSGYFSGYLPQPTMYPPDIDRMCEMAVNAAYAKMNSSDVLSGELLSDLDKTVGMLRRPFSGSVSLLNKMLRYKKLRLGKTVKSAIRASSDAWLEYRYGWQPLLLDAETVIKKSHKIRESAVKKRLVARASESWSAAKQASTAGVAVSADWQVSGSSAVTQSTVASAGVVYGVDPQSFMSAASQFFGTQASDLPATVWEILPYSFVVDWFIGVGSWIQSVTPRPGIQVLGSWVTTKEMKESRFYPTLRHKYGPIPSYMNVQMPEFRHKTESVRRYIDASPSRTPVVSTRPLSLLHSVDACALLSQQAVNLLGKLHH